MYDILSYLNHRIRVQETFCAVINFRNANIYQHGWTSPSTILHPRKEPGLNPSPIYSRIHFQAQLLLFPLTDFVMSLAVDPNQNPNLVFVPISATISNSICDSGSVFSPVSCHCFWFLSFGSCWLNAFYAKPQYHLAMSGFWPPPARSQHVRSFHCQKNPALAPDSGWKVLELCLIFWK